MPYEPGDRVGDYEVVDVLGAGGMGKVYKVRNVISDRIEAMKVLLPNLETDPDLADRFAREIKVQASLQHPNIAGLHTAFRVNNQLLMLLEFVEGYTIDQELRRGRLGFEKAIEYTRQVLAALSYAHQNGVVHRDVKPSNMMVMPSGVVKLMDFGIAKDTSGRGLTRTGQTVGSLYYMSPEQIQGSTTLDGRSDLYSVGVSLYEMVTGRRPFTGDSDYSIMAAHLNAAPTPPIQVDPTLPPALNDVILMAIAKDPGKRFQSAEAFSAALASVLGSLAPTEAMAPPPPLKSRRGLYMAIGSAATIAVLAVAAIQAPKVFRSSTAATTSQPAVNQPSAPAPAAPSPAMPESERQPITPEPLGSNPPAQVRQDRRVAGRSMPSAIPAVTKPRASKEETHTMAAAQTPVPATAAPQQTTPAAPAPTIASPSAQELDSLRERMSLMAARANSVRASLSGLRRQMGGMNLNAEFTTREQRMETFLDEAERNLKASDAARARKSLDSAERALEDLEKKLGR